MKMGSDQQSVKRIAFMAAMNNIDGHEHTPRA
jgi:hypothetical protein